MVFFAFITIETLIFVNNWQFVHYNVVWLNKKYYLCQQKLINMVKFDIEDAHYLEKLIGIGYLAEYGQTAEELLKCNDIYWLDVWLYLSRELKVVISPEKWNDVNTNDVMIMVYIRKYTAIKYKWFDDVEKGIINAIIYIISSEIIYEQLKFIYNERQKYGK